MEVNVCVGGAHFVCVYLYPSWEPGWSTQTPWKQGAWRQGPSPSVSSAWGPPQQRSTLSSSLLKGLLTSLDLLNGRIFDNENLVIKNHDARSDVIEIVNIVIVWLTYFFTFPNCFFGGGAISCNDWVKGKTSIKHLLNTSCICIFETDPLRKERDREVDHYNKKYMYASLLGLIFLKIYDLHDPM